MGMLIKSFCSFRAELELSLDQKEDEHWQRRPEDAKDRGVAGGGVKRGQGWIPTGMMTPHGMAKPPDMNV